MNPFDLAQRYIGVKELSGTHNHPLISWWLSLCYYSLDAPDEIPWCSAFVNGIAWELRLPRSKSAAARSWLNVGIPVFMHDARVGDIVIFKRNDNPAQGHVGFYAGIEGSNVIILGGNQSNSVCLAKFPQGDVLGVRRIING
jgi:uncharacterized protein (TIGR02594 family)